MHFKLGVNDNGEPVPVIDDADTDVPAIVFEKLRLFAGIDEGSAKALVELVNAVGSAGYSKGYDDGYAEADSSWQESVQIW